MLRLAGIILLAIFLIYLYYRYLAGKPFFQNIIDSGKKIIGNIIDSGKKLLGASEIPEKPEQKETSENKEYTCIQSPGVGWVAVTPMNGNIACASSDGMNCVAGSSNASCHNELDAVEKKIPVMCTDEMKKDPESWCNYKF